MALVPCPKCGHRISSLARFCPKCPQQDQQTGRHSTGQSPRSTANDPVDGVPPAPSAAREVDAGPDELHQHEFKPSPDEMIVLEERTFLINSLFSVQDGYAYLTSKRYVLCDASGSDIIFQTGIDRIASAAEGRHIFTRKITVTTIDHEEFQIKCRSHKNWLAMLGNPRAAVSASRKTGAGQTGRATGNTDWFYEVDGIRVGPVKEKSVIQLIQNNHTIYPGTRVWNAALPEWKQADETILTIYFNESYRSRQADSGDRSTVLKITEALQKYL